MAIYLNIHNNTLGPYSEAELRDMLQHREVRPEVMAWKEGDPEWTTLGTCLGSDSPAPTPVKIPGPGRGPVPAAAPVAAPAAAVPAPLVPTRGLSPAEALRAKMGTPSATAESPSPRSDPEPARKERSPSMVSQPAAISQAGSGRASKDILHGALWCVGGTIATVIGYLHASDGGGGGRYFIFWGAIVFGGFQLLRGLFSR